MNNFKDAMKELGKRAARKAAKDLEGYHRAIEILKRKKK